MINRYHMTCEGAPIQIEGTFADERCFYFRSRHRTVTLGIGDTPEAALTDPDTVGFTAIGFEEDDHPLSSVDDPIRLLYTLYDMRESMIKYRERRKM